jgi:predicted RNase H-related nuclease YkuK (DUF458 family)
MFKDKFKKFGGDFIPDIVEYLKNHILENPSVTISVGCDSSQKRRKTFYALTIMMYNSDIKNGAHVVFYRQSFDKIRDNNERLQKEAFLAYELAEYLDSELSSFYQRSDISDFQRKWYKYHLMKSSEQFSYLQPQDVHRYVNNISLTDGEKIVQYKLVDIHLDFNPFESTQHSKGRTNNRSNLAYKAYIPWLRGMNYKVFCKPMSHAATGAADLLLQD